MLKYISREAAVCFLPVTLSCVFNYLFMYVFIALVIFNFNKKLLLQRRFHKLNKVVNFYLNLVKTFCV